MIPKYTRKARKPATKLNDRPQQDEPIQQQQNSITNPTTRSINNSNIDREILAEANRHYIEAQAAAHETKLANEIRQITAKSQPFNETKLCF